MTEFIVKRLLQLIPLLFVISLVTFFVIELPPGDYLTSRILRLREAGGTMAQAEIDRLTAQYGLDKPVHVRGTSSGYGTSLGTVTSAGPLNGQAGE